MGKVFSVTELDAVDNAASYLLLINPDKIPHLVYIQSGKYYSLTYKESLIDLPFDHYFKKLKKLKKKMLFIELVESSSKAQEVFSNYLKADTGTTTCFVPIKDLILPNSKSEMIFELIPELYENQMIKKVSHLNLAADLDESKDFTLSVYNKDLIFSYIKALNKKDASR